MVIKCGKAAGNSKTFVQIVVFYWMCELQ